MKRFGLNELTADNTRMVSKCMSNDLFEAAQYFKEHYAMDRDKDYEVYEIDGICGDYIMFGNMLNDALLFENLKKQLEAEGYYE